MPSLWERLMNKDEYHSKKLWLDGIRDIAIIIGVVTQTVLVWWLINR